MMESSDLLKPATSTNSWGRTLRYLLLAAGFNFALLSMAFYFAKNSPRLYSSNWSLIFPGGATDTRVDLPNIGSAQSRADSPFNKEQDVKETYKVIASTDEVRRAAAAKLGMTPTQFGKPRIEVVEGTALMNFEIKGSSGEEARRKAIALQEAFEERLNQLRVKQAAEQEAGFERSLSVAREKLERAQYRLSDYKLRSGLTSPDQIQQLSASIETLRRLRAEVVAQQRDSNTRASRLSGGLSIDSRLAGDAFALRADPLFQQYIRDYSETTANLTAASSKFGPNHPIIQRETARQAAAQAALESRGERLLGRPVDAGTIARLNVGNPSVGNTAREDLYKQIVVTDVEQQGLAARAREIDNQMSQLEQRLSTLAQRGATLDALNREMQVAEAVFSSTLASLDASKADIFGAYPPIQMVAAPSLSSAPSEPNTKLIMLGAAGGSVLVTLGLLLLWLRKTPLGRSVLRRQPRSIESSLGLGG